MGACICCGERPAQGGSQTGRHCYGCNMLTGHAHDMSDAWPLLFAHSMQRLARLAEIAELDDRVRTGTFYIANPDHEGADDGEMFRAALRRLVELAKGTA